MRVINQNQLVMKVPNQMVAEKIGYDWRVKMMMCRVAPALYEFLEKENPLKVNKSWANVIRLMFISEGKDLNNLNISINGYYNAVKRNLKEIGVIRYEGKELVKGSNWNRFYSDEDWSWFIANTDSYGHAEIIK